MITHSVTPTGYDLTVNGKLLARVVKDEGEYCVIDGEAFWLLDRVTYHTMKALKEALALLIPEEMKIKNRQSYRPTQTDVRMAGGSHARTGQAIKEMCRMYPEKRRIPGWINAALIYSHMEACADWGFAPAVRWLESNYRPAGYSREDFKARSERAYGPQPEWTR